MTSEIDTLGPMNAANVARPRSGLILHVHPCVDRKEKGREKKKMAWGSAQPLEKARFGQGNPRKCKLFSLIFFGWAWPGFAGLG
jgi:hypothetical protein